jgi:3-oxoacyl-[acyl-carrier protein] reductase
MTATNRVVLVTGSSRGIGAAIARRFAERGDRVVLHGRDEAALASVGCGALTCVADLTSFDAVEAMRASIEGQLGPLDVLVANAGGSPEPPGPLEDHTVAGWHAALAGNLTATFFTLKSFLPGMKQRKRGNVITISSAAARRPHVRNPIGYAAAKAGIESMTQDVALQAGPFGVRVNCISPETILTERNELRIPEELKPKLAEAHPIQRLGTPDDVAHAAVFLASDEASWITGVILDIAGGAVCKR